MKKIIQQKRKIMLKKKTKNIFEFILRQEFIMQNKNATRKELENLVEVLNKRAKDKSKTNKNNQILNYQTF